MKKTIQVTQLLLAGILIGIILLFLCAVLHRPEGSFTNKGSFEVLTYNEGWTLQRENATEEKISLPFSVEEKKGDVSILTHRLPLDIENGMILMTKVRGRYLHIYIDGELREYYNDEFFSNKNIPGAYLAVALDEKDAGKTITMKFESFRNSKNTFRTVYYGYGNNVWFPVIVQNLPINMTAVFLVLFGLMAGCVYLFLMHRLQGSKAVLYLAESLIVAGLWMLSESELRQLLFRGISYCTIFSFLLIEILPAFITMYLDEVTGRRYHKLYGFYQMVVVLLIVHNGLLHYLGIREFYDTLILSHIWSAIGLLIEIYIIIQELKWKKVKEYRIIANGIILLMVSFTVELFCFYLVKGIALGYFIGIGLVCLMIATIVQTIRSEINRIELARVNAEELTYDTIKTIANAIDAKDKYTGGHSQRVGEYAYILAREVANTYHFTEKDLINIRYIGMMHDIGKIGVADAVLNKQARLDDAEYMIMKTHAKIGGDILKDIHNLPGLWDAVRHHHERYDGGGYPDGLKGEDISVVARILCIVDSFDAMTSNRVYRKKLPMEQVIEELSNCKGKQFDPALTEVFIELIKTGKISYSF